MPTAGIYFSEPEITPYGQGSHRMSGNGTLRAEFPPETEIRALVEGQFLAKLNHATKLGYHMTRATRVLATGGASANTDILQVIYKYVLLCPL